VTAEIESFVSKHGTTGGSYAARLAEIPLTAWEEEMPILEACHSEMIRILMNGLAMRQNVSGEMKIDGVPIKKGDYIGYSLSDVHMNPDIYPNPKKFDPTRFLGESRKAPLSFVGWGAGEFSSSLFKNFRI
jgi:cytochrome P450